MSFSRISQLAGSAARDPFVAQIFNRAGIGCAKDRFSFAVVCDFVMLLVRAAGCVGVWCAYSWCQKKELHGKTFKAMQLLSETRRPDGRPSKAWNLLSTKPTTTTSAMNQDATFLAGNQSVSGTIYRILDGLYCQTDPEYEAFSYGLFGTRRPTTYSLRELVAQHSTKSFIYEDVATRLNYMTEIDNCKPLLVPDLVQGNYSFCFRDYVNHEELMAMLGRRWCIDRLLLKATRTGRLIAPSSSDSSKPIVLRERGLMLGFVPVQIDWEGHVETNEQNNAVLLWDTTSLQLGWKRWGKLYEKPKLAEELRNDPWEIYVPPGDTTGDVLVFHRLQSGKLVYARDDCLKQ